jgi:AcrR family transcriptional regulator
MSYSQPLQNRAKKTEALFLDALDQLLAEKGYTNTTINDVAALCGLTRAAFIKRFGSKERAVLILFEAYCNDASETMTRIQAGLETDTGLHDVLRKISNEFEGLLTEHLGVNRAMHEHFMQNLQVHTLTKRIFIECVTMMEKIQSQYLKHVACSSQGAWGASQLLVTIDYNYVLKAMPGLPTNSEQRHGLIADILQVALQR